MSERLSDVEARIGTVHQLAAVITAMRGIAAARVREAQSHLEAMRASAEVTGSAIGRALALLPARRDPPEEPKGGHAVLAVCAEQGFAGTFSDRVLDAARRVAVASAASELLLVGDRGLLVADEHGDRVAWSAPMIAHVDQAAALADWVVDMLYRRIDGGSVARVTLVYAVPDTAAGVRIVERRLLPFDFARVPVARNGGAPDINLQPAVLLARLAEEYVFAEVCEALVLSFAAENEARMRAMIAARGNVLATLDDLVGRSRRLRQDEITNEIVELASGAAASTSRSC